MALLSDVANDIKWLIKEEASKNTRDTAWQAKIEAQLTTLNGTTDQNCKDIAVNRDRIETTWKIGGTLFALFLILVGVTLHLLGIY